MSNIGTAHKTFEFKGSTPDGALLIWESKGPLPGDSRHERITIRRDEFWKTPAGGDDHHIPETRTPMITPREIAEEKADAIRWDSNNSAYVNGNLIEDLITEAIEADRAQRQPHLETLIDAAEKWRTELHEYIIPNAVETSDEDAERYGREADRIDVAIAAAKEPTA